MAEKKGVGERRQGDWIRCTLRKKKKTDRMTNRLKQRKRKPHHRRRREVSELFASLEGVVVELGLELLDPAEGLR